MQELDISPDGTTITVMIPMKFRTRGGRKPMIAPDGAHLSASPRPRADTTLVKALARAFRWQDMQESGRYATVSEIAKAEKMNMSYVSHVLRLTLLAPELVEAILEGRQPPTMQLQPLTDHPVLPFNMRHFESLQCSILVWQSIDHAPISALSMRRTLPPSAA